MGDFGEGLAGWTSRVHSAALRRRGVSCRPLLTILLVGHFQERSVSTRGLNIAHYDPSSETRGVTVLNTSFSLFLAMPT